MKPHQNPHIFKAVRIMGSQAKLAKAIGSSQSTINRLLDNVRAVTADEAIRIEKVTKGRVTVKNLCPAIHSAIRRSLLNTHPEVTPSTQDGGETGERPEKGSAARAVGSGAALTSAQADQAVAATGRGKRRSTASRPASDAALNTVPGGA